MFWSILDANEVMEWLKEINSNVLCSISVVIDVKEWPNAIIWVCVSVTIAVKESNNVLVSITKGSNWSVFNCIWYDIPVRQSKNKLVDFIKSSTSSNNNTTSSKFVTYVNWAK